MKSKNRIPVIQVINRKKRISPGSEMAIHLCTKERSGYVIDSDLKQIAYTYYDDKIDIDTPDATLTISLENLEIIVDELDGIIEEIKGLKRIDPALPKGR